MIIVKKPFIYLRDHHDWKYGKFRRFRAFMDLNRFMLLERREDKTCETFQTEKDKSTKDAEYVVITLLDFLDHCNVGYEEHADGVLYCQYSIKGWWSFPFLKLALKVIRNAEIVIPTKEVFPLIVRNERYNFYIAGGIEEKERL